MRRLLSLAFLLLLPTVSAEDIPALNGGGTYRFIAAWAASDGAIVPGGGTQYFNLYGATAPRDAETEVTTQAAYSYNITNFRVAPATVNCGSLAAGESFSFAVRKNNADTSLTGSCAFGAAANSFTLDTDIVTVTTGDRLTLRVTQVGAVIPVTLQIGLSLEGFDTVNITTNPVVDMTNEMLETVFVIAPFVALIVLIAWAEQSREWLIYILAILAGIVCVVNQPNQLTGLRLVEVGTIVLLIIRAAWVYQTRKDVDENAS